MAFDLPRRIAESIRRLLTQPIDELSRWQRALRFALDQERVPVLGVGVRQVRNDVLDLLCIRPGFLHAILGLAQLARRYHLHGLGDLLRVLDTRDLAADFLRA